MSGGYMGRVAFVDLTEGTVRTEALPGDVSREFIGGYGLGARVLFERMPKGVDALGPGTCSGSRPAR